MCGLVIPPKHKVKSSSWSTVQRRPWLCPSVLSHCQQRCAALGTRGRNHGSRGRLTEDDRRWLLDMEQGAAVIDVRLIGNDGGCGGGWLLKAAAVKAAGVHRPNTGARLQCPKFAIFLPASNHDPHSIRHCVYSRFVAHTLDMELDCRWSLPYTEFSLLHGWMKCCFVFEFGSSSSSTSVHLQGLCARNACVERGITVNNQQTSPMHGISGRMALHRLAPQHIITPHSSSNF